MQRAADHGAEVPRIPGFPQVLDLLSIIADPEKARAALQQLREIDDKVVTDDQNRLRLAKAHKLSEEAATDRQLAAELLAAAQIKSESLIEATRVGLEAQTAQIRQQAADNKATKRELDQLAKKIREDQAAVDKLQAEMSAEMLKAKELDARARKLLEQYQNKYTKLTAAMA